jgi:hypothetical protein
VTRNTRKQPIIESAMKTYYEISSDVTGKVLLRRRKIAKALRWWLNEHGYTYKYLFYSA